MIHLIGVDHFRAQRKKRGLELTEIQRQYQSLVESVIQSIHPDLLAEEDHPDYLAEDGAESILYAVAQSHGIKHTFIEADRATQKKLGYKDFGMIYELLIPEGNPSEKAAIAHKLAHQFPIRERFWIQELGKSSADNILVICGDLHLHTFTTILIASGIPYSIYAEKIGVDLANNIEYEGLKYALDHMMFGETDCFCLK